MSCTSCMAPALSSPCCFPGREVDVANLTIREPSARFPRLTPARTLTQNLSQPERASEIRPHAPAPRSASGRGGAGRHPCASACRSCAATPGSTIVIKYGGHAMGDEHLAVAVRPRHRPAQAGRHQPGRRPWRRPADQRHAQAPGHPIELRRRPAGHRRRHGRGRRDGAGRHGQQTRRRADQPGRRAGGRHLRQGWRPDPRPQAAAHRAGSRAAISSACWTSASSASRSMSTCG